MSFAIPDPLLKTGHTYRSRWWSNADILSVLSHPAVLCRKFLESNYKPIKQSNPDVPFLVREASGTPARAFARFGK